MVSEKNCRVGVEQTEFAWTRPVAPPDRWVVLLFATHGRPKAPLAPSASSTTTTTTTTTAITTTTTTTNTTITTMLLYYVNICGGTKMAGNYLRTKKEAPQPKNTNHNDVHDFAGS